jgi:hypothetical protein
VCSPSTRLVYLIIDRSGISTGGCPSIILI